MAELDNPVWDEGSVLDSREYLYIHEIPRPDTSPQHPKPISVTPPKQTDQELPDTPFQQPSQV